MGLGARLWTTEDLNKGTSILPVEEHVFIELSDERKVNWKGHRFFRERLKRIGIMIYYESIYRDSCQTKLNQHSDKEIFCFDLY